MKKLIPYIFCGQTLIVLEETNMTDTGQLVMQKTLVASFPRDRSGCINAVMAAMSDALRI